MQPFNNNDGIKVASDSIWFFFCLVGPAPTLDDDGQLTFSRHQLLGRSIRQSVPTYLLKRLSHLATESVAPVPQGLTGNGEELVDSKRRLEEHQRIRRVGELL